MLTNYDVIREEERRKTERERSSMSPYERELERLSEDRLKEEIEKQRGELERISGSATRVMNDYRGDRAIMAAQSLARQEEQASAGVRTKLQALTRESDRRRRPRR